MKATFKNKKVNPIVFYYLTEKSQKSVRILGGDSVTVEDFKEVANVSKSQVSNGFFDIIIEGENNFKDVKNEDKMKKAIEDVESYIETKKSKSNKKQ